MNKITEVKIERGIPTLYVDGQPFWRLQGRCTTQPPMPRTGWRQRYG